jgi:hypothetical protein
MNTDVYWPDVWWYTAIVLAYCYPVPDFPVYSPFLDCLFLICSWFSCLYTVPAFLFIYCSWFSCMHPCSWFACLWHVPHFPVYTLFLIFLLIYCFSVSCLYTVPDLPVSMLFLIFLFINYTVPGFPVYGMFLVRLAFSWVAFCRYTHYGLMPDVARAIYFPPITLSVGHGATRLTMFQTTGAWFVPPPPPHRVHRERMWRTKSPFSYFRHYTGLTSSK